MFGKIYRGEKDYKTTNLTFASRLAPLHVLELNFRDSCFMRPKFEASNCRMAQCSVRKLMRCKLAVYRKTRLVFELINESCNID